MTMTGRSLSTWDDVHAELERRRIPKAWIAEYVGAHASNFSIASSVVNKKRSVTLPDPDTIWEAIQAIEGGWRPAGAEARP